MSSYDYNGVGDNKTVTDYDYLYDSNGFLSAILGKMGRDLVVKYEYTFDNNRRENTCKRWRIQYGKDLGDQFKYYYDFQNRVIKVRKIEWGGMKDILVYQYDYTEYAHSKVHNNQILSYYDTGSPISKDAFTFKDQFDFSKYDLNSNWLKEDYREFNILNLMSKGFIERKIEYYK